MHERDLVKNNQNEKYNNKIEKVMSKLITCPVESYVQTEQNEMHAFTQSFSMGTKIGFLTRNLKLTLTPIYKFTLPSLQRTISFVNKELNL